MEESDSGSDPDLSELELVVEDPIRDTNEEEYIAEMLRSRLDIDGRVFEEGWIFSSRSEAAAFVPFRDRGILAEFECRMLFDYHSGFSIVDLDLYGGQSVMVCAEEYETYVLGKEDDEDMIKTNFPMGYLRGQKYALVRDKDSFLSSSLGLVPMSYLVEEHFYSMHPEVFIDPTWYLGVCSYDQAISYLISDPFIMNEGLFVIFSPRWLNVDPNDPRPFILIMLTQRNHTSCDKANKSGEIAYSDFEPKFDQLVRHADRTDAALIRRITGQQLSHAHEQNVHERKHKRKKIKTSVEKTAAIEKTTVEKPKAPRKIISAATSMESIPIEGGTSEIDRTVTGKTRRSVTMDRRTKKFPIKEPRKKKECRMDFLDSNKSKAKTKRFRGLRNRIKGKDIPQKKWQAIARLNKRIQQPREAVHIRNYKRIPQYEEQPFRNMTYLKDLPFIILPYTIKRSYLGDFELFGERYPTLYHLVIYLSINASELPHKLLLERFKKPPCFNVTPMEPPMRVHKRNKAALPMHLEQWASKHYMTVTEPFYQTSLVQYVVRSIFNPMKNLWKKLGMDIDELKKMKTNIKMCNEIRKDAPPDEHSLRIDSRIVIKPENLDPSMVLLGSENQMEKDREVVVKEFIVQGTHQDRMLAFVQEIEAASAVRHVNIAMFYGVMTTIHRSEVFNSDEFFSQAQPGAEGVAGNVMLVFEFIKGKSLEPFLKEGDGKSDKNVHVEKLSSNMMIDFLAQIARALAYLHTRSPPLVHGDIAARNIMVSYHPKDRGRYLLKLIDFGLAKFSRSDLNVHYDSQTMPAPWLPLETLKHGDLSPMTDVWSFGCVVWEMFGGTPWGNPSPLVQGICVPGQYIYKPDLCPDFLFNLILLCHRPMPQDRITMVETEEYLMRHYIEHEGAYLAESFKRSLA